MSGLDRQYLIDQIANNTDLAQDYIIGGAPIVQAPGASNVYDVSDELNTGVGAPSIAPLNGGIAGNTVGPTTPPDLMTLDQMRAKSPYLPIFNRPTIVKTVPILDTNPVQVSVPSGAKLMVATARNPSQVVFMSLTGNAYIPAAYDDGNTAAPVLLGEFTLPVFVGGLSSFSVIGSAAGAYASFAFYF